jgi:hypothetical protein
MADQRFAAAAIERKAGATSGIVGGHLKRDEALRATLDVRANTRIVRACLVSGAMSIAARKADSGTRGGLRAAPVVFGHHSEKACADLAAAARHALPMSADDAKSWEASSRPRKRAAPPPRCDGPTQGAASRQVTSQRRCCSHLRRRAC